MMTCRWLYRPRRMSSHCAVFTYSNALTSATAVGQERPAETSSVEHCSRSGSSVVRPLKAPVYQDNGCESSQLAAKLESVPKLC